MEYHFSAVSPRSRGRRWVALTAATLAALLVGLLYFYSPRFFSIDTPVDHLQLGHSGVERVEVTVTNTSGQEIGLEPVFLSGRVYDQATDLLTEELERVGLGRLESGESRRYSLGISAPPKPGRYRVVVDIVKEHSYWYSEVGNFPKVIEIEVE